MMDLKDNTYEDIEESSSATFTSPPPPLNVAAATMMTSSGISSTLFKSQSDSDLLKLLQKCGQEVEMINNLIKGHHHQNHNSNHSKDVTFSLYGQLDEPEQGFYKCHDSIYDVPEGQRIPDLKKVRQQQPVVAALVPPPPPKAIISLSHVVGTSKQSNKQRRLSLDSGHGTSVAGDEYSLDTSFSSMPSLYQGNNTIKNYEDLNTSLALEQICGGASLESLPGFCPPSSLRVQQLESPPPPTLPPRRQKGLIDPPPPVPPPSLKKANGLPPALMPTTITTTTTTPASALNGKAEWCPKGQSPRGICRKQLFESSGGSNKRSRLFSLKYSLKKSKLTPVKLLNLAASPFLKKRAGGGLVTPRRHQHSSSPDDDFVKENSFERRLNLECYKEAKRYDMPIIPFPYQHAATPTAMPPQILSAATEGPPINGHRNLRRPTGPPNSAIPRRLNFEEDITPSLVVKALATPSINRRVVQLPVVPQHHHHHSLLLPEMMPLPSTQHCSSCTCNQAVVGIPTVRREMISDMVGVGVSTQRNFLPWRLSGFSSLDGGAGCDATSNGTDASLPRGLNNNQDCSSNQQDYVKMSAKLF